METLWTSSNLEWQDFIWTDLSACSARTHLVSIVRLQRKTCERKTWRSELSGFHLTFKEQELFRLRETLKEKFQGHRPCTSGAGCGEHVASPMVNFIYSPKFSGIYLRSSNFSFNNLIRRTSYFFFFEIDFALTESFIQFLVNYPSGGNANRYLGCRIGVVWVGLLAFCQESLLVGGRSKCINCKNLEVLVHWSMEIGDFDCKFRWTLIASRANVICSVYLHCTVRMLARFGVYS